MSYLTKRIYLESDECVKFFCDTQCNAFLVDDSNHSNYKAGRSYRYYGGFHERFPIYLTPPNAGNWNIIIDLGGGSATIRHSFDIVKI